MEHFVAVYASAVEADSAETDLLGVGVPASAIRKYPGDTTTTLEAGTAPAEQRSSFWRWLLGEDDDAARRPAQSYDGLTGGQMVLSVSLDDTALSGHVISILTLHNPIDITGPEATWAPTEPPLSVPVQEEDVVADAPVPDASAAPAGRAELYSRRNALTGRLPSTADEQIIPLAGEDVKIGKRMVNLGSRLVHRYVVERPVEQDVTLHGERVTIERRAPTGAADPGVPHFEERTVIAQETAEEPVVQKEVGVTEEVVVRTEPTERTETVRDTERREEAEIKHTDKGI